MKTENLKVGDVLIAKIEMPLSTTPTLEYKITHFKNQEVHFINDEDEDDWVNVARIDKYFAIKETPNKMKKTAEEIKEMAQSYSKNLDNDPIRITSYIKGYTQCQQDSAAKLKDFFIEGYNQGFKRGQTGLGMYNLDLLQANEYLDRKTNPLNKQSKTTKSTCVVCGKQYQNPNNDSDTCYDCREPHTK